MHFLFQVCYFSTCNQRSLLTSCNSVFLVSSLLYFNFSTMIFLVSSVLLFSLPSTITTNELLLCTQYTLFQVACSSICYYRSLITRCFLLLSIPTQTICYSVFIISSLLHFNLQSAITDNQLLFSWPCFKFVTLQPATNDNC